MLLYPISHFTCADETHRAPFSYYILSQPPSNRAASILSLPDLLRRQALASAVAVAARDGAHALAHHTLEALHHVAVHLAPACAVASRAHLRPLVLARGAYQHGPCAWPRSRHALLAGLAAAEEPVEEPRARRWHRYHPNAAAAVGGGVGAGKRGGGGGGAAEGGGAASGE